MLKWFHAAGLLYGDWGTSRLYVLGLAFFYSGSAAPLHVLAMCVLLAAVAWAYTVVCRCFTDGGGVYSSAKATHHHLALLGAYLLFADYTITAALSAVEAMRYVGFSTQSAGHWAILAVFAMGIVNFVGPRNAGRVAAYIGVATLGMIVIIAAFSVPHLGFDKITPDRRPPGDIWTSFVYIILALSGVEAIANMTGVMVEPVHKTARRAIWLVLAEVIFFNLLFTLAIGHLPGLPGGILASQPGPLSHEQEALRDTMMTVVADHFVPIPHFATIAAVVFGLLLLSAVNTAVAGMISVQYAMARDRELPRAFVALNLFGVPWVPLLTAMGVSAVVLLFQGNTEALAHLYAIGVIGAILINLGSTCINRQVELRTYERVLLGIIWLVLVCVEFTIAIRKLEALVFVLIVIAGGYALRLLVKKAPAYAPHIPKLTESFARLFQAPELPAEGLSVAGLPAFDPGKPKILVASRGNPNLVKFAAEEAAQRGANLLVLFVRDIAVNFGPAATASPEPDKDAEAIQVFSVAQAAAREKEISLMPIYVVSPSIPDVILDYAATYAVDFVIMGVSRRGALFRVLRGDVITRVADHLPPETTLLIHV